MKAIILAGGGGSRLYPLSNEETPKQLLALNDKFSLLQNTFLRASDFAHPSDILTVTNCKFKDKTSEQLKVLFPTAQLLCEPCARNTAPAINCALEYLYRQSGDDTVVILPADHLIMQKDLFSETIRNAAKLAERNYIVTLGIKPDYPETGFGYIKCSDTLDCGFKVEKFVEKPSLQIAQEYVNAGNYYWNGGIFVGKISVFLQEFAEFAPDIAKLASDCTFDNGIINEFTFFQMPKISIDYAIMEKSHKTALVELFSDWSDLGSWQAIYDLYEKDENGNVIIGKAILHNVKNSLIYSPDNISAVADTENRIFVNIQNTVMSCGLQNSQNVKYLYDKSKK